MLATKNKEVVRYFTEGGERLYGTITPGDEYYPERYYGIEVSINDIITTVGHYVNGEFSLISTETGYIISYVGYVSLEVLGSFHNRSYQPYTPQFVDL